MIPLKAGYEPRLEIAERTRRALAGDDDQLHRDAINLFDFTDDHKMPVIRRYLERRPGHKILDVGCGYGRHCPLLTSCGAAFYLGIDPNPDRILFAREHHSGPGRRFEIGDSTFDTEDRFDLIWCCTVLQHLPIEEKLATCAMMSRLRAPGGVILIEDGMIMNADLDACRRHYESELCPEHMIPMPLAMVMEAFGPLAMKVMPGALYWISEVRL